MIEIIDTKLKENGSPDGGIECLAKFNVARVNVYLYRRSLSTFIQSQPKRIRTLVFAKNASCKMLPEK